MGGGWSWHRILLPQCWTDSLPTTQRKTKIPFEVSPSGLVHCILDTELRSNGRGVWNRISVGKPYEKKPFVRLRLYMEGNLETDVKETWFVVVLWSEEIKIEPSCRLV